MFRALDTMLDSRQPMANAWGILRAHRFGVCTRQDSGVSGARDCESAHVAHPDYPSKGTRVLVFCLLPWPQGPRYSEIYRSNFLYTPNALAPSVQLYPLCTTHTRHYPIPSCHVFSRAIQTAVGVPFDVEPSCGSRLNAPARTLLKPHAKAPSRAT